MSVGKTNMKRMTAEMSFGFSNCALGTMLVAATGQGVAAILLGDERDELRCQLQSRFPGVKLVEDAAALAPAMTKIADFIAAPASGLDLPLDPQGSAFQLLVWQRLREIPAGTSVSYAEIAHRLGRPRAVRAVARACAANALAIAIPCHRVVRSDGSLAGYRWGVARKAALLALEAA